LQALRAEGVDDLGYCLSRTAFSAELARKFVLRMFAARERSNRQST